MIRIIYALSLVFLTCFSSYANLYINEVNSTGKWIEIYNSGENSVNIGGYFIVRNNNDGASGVTVLPVGTTIASKGYLVIYQGPVSGGTSASPVEGAIDCLAYGISSEKFMNAILKDKQGYIVDDSFDIGNPQTVTVTGGKSWARETDGAAAIVALDPTPGKPNVIMPPSELKIYVNEVNSSGKWIELYNDEDNVVNVGYYTVTRSNYDGVSSAIIPAGTTIASKGFLVLYQGSVAPSPTEGAIDCMDFGISSDRFMNAVLRDDRGSIVDETFDIGNPQTVKVSGVKSWARQTDGAATIEALDPTPGKPNAIELPPSELQIYVNEVNSTGKWIELYNDENDAVNVGFFSVTRNNNDGGTSLAIIPSGTTIASKGFLVLYQGSVMQSPVEGAIDCMDFGISATRFMNVILKDDQGRIVDNTFDIGNPQTVIISEDNGESWARETDGAATIVALDPSPGTKNNILNGLISVRYTDNILASVYAGTLRLPEKTSHVQLFTVSGNLILSRNVTVTSIDLVNLPKGFYVVKMTISGKSFTQKIVL